MTTHHSSQPTESSARERLRQYWLQFEEFPGYTLKDGRNEYINQLLAGNRAALDELVAQGELSAPVADILQEAYKGGIHHIARSRSFITCYRMSFTYSPVSAQTLIKQSGILRRLAEEGAIDPSTLAKAQAALEHNLSYYTLSEEEEAALNEMEPHPGFGELALKQTPETQAATQFIIALLTGRDHTHNTGTVEPVDYQAQSMEVEANDQPARERLRQCWLRLDQLEPTPEDKGIDHQTRDTWAAQHQAALNELVAQEALSTQAARMVQEAYEGMVHYVPSVGMARLKSMCYRVTEISTKEPNSPPSLIGRLRVLNQVAAAGTIKPETLKNVEHTIAYDMAAFSVQGMEMERRSENLPRLDPETGKISSVYGEVMQKWMGETRVAIQFIMDLLTGK